MYLPKQSGLPHSCFLRPPSLPFIVGIQILSFQNRAGGNVNTLYCLGKMLVTHKTNSMSFGWLRKYPCVCAGQVCHRLPSAQINVGVIEERAAAKGK